MKMLSSWPLVLPLNVVFSLFFGWLCIHTSLALYFNVEPFALENLNVGSTRLYWCVSVLTGFMSTLFIPYMYWLHLKDDVKYEERIDVPLDKLDITAYSNVSVVVTNDHAWVLRKNSFGLDLQKQGYLTFYNYYDRHKKFKSTGLRTRHIK